MITHPRLAEVVCFLRPNAKPLIDFSVEDIGSGPYLKQNLVINPVTDQEVAAVTNQQLDTFKSDVDKTNRIDNARNADLLTVVLSLENDNRLIKAKINTLSPGSFTVGQASQITMDQLKTGLKALLS